MSHTQKSAESTQMYVLGGFLFYRKLRGIDLAVWYDSDISQTQIGAHTEINIGSAGAQITEQFAAFYRTIFSGSSITSTIGIAFCRRSRRKSPFAMALLTIAIGKA